MKRIGLLGLLLLAMCAFGGVTASSSMAACLVDAEPGKGDFTNSECTTKGAGEWIWVKQEKQYLGNGIWCAETTFAGEGDYEDPQCQKPKVAGNFAKVYQGPYWHANGVKLEGKRQIKLQLKGKAVLAAPTLGTTGLEVSCNESHSEGGTIESNGLSQGQDKGQISYSSCTVLKPVSGCTVAEPIVTKPTKSYLAINAGGQQKIVDVFEPTEGTKFVELHFIGAGCGVIAGFQPVAGSVYAELIPRQGEVQEGLLNFPTSPVEKVKHEGIEKTIELTTAGAKATFSGAYGARLATNEPFGAL
jgi:hypothetical protein